MSIIGPDRAEMGTRVGRTVGLAVLVFACGALAMMASPHPSNAQIGSRFGIGSARTPDQSTPSQPLLGTARECLDILSRAEWARVPATNSNYARAQDCIRKIDAAQAIPQSPPTATVPTVQPLPPENQQPRTTPPSAVPSVTLPGGDSSLAAGPGAAQPVPTPAASTAAPSNAARDAPRSGDATSEAGSALPSAHVIIAAGRIRRAGQTTDSPVTTDTVMRQGDEIRTGPNERAVVQFSDGSRIELGPKGSFLLDSREPTLLQQAGKLFYFIKSGQLLKVRVKVRNPPPTVSVRGTAFSIDIAEDESSFRVEVLEGVVEVTSADKTIEVTAGQGVTVRSGEAPPSPSVMPTAQARPSGKDAETARVFSPVLLLVVLGLFASLVVGGTLVFIRARRRGVSS